MVIKKAIDVTGRDGLEEKLPYGVRLLGRVHGTNGSSFLCIGYQGVYARTHREPCVVTSENGDVIIQPIGKEVPKDLGLNYCPECKLAMINEDFNPEFAYL